MRLDFVQQSKLISRMMFIPVQTAFITAVLAAIGTDLIVQSDRYYLTPAYGVLLDIVNADIWGVVYLVAAAGLFVYIVLPRNHVVGVITHTLVVILLGVWEFAFVVRWSTDKATTAINVVSWLTYLALAIWSAVLVNRRPIRS